MNLSEGEKLILAMLCDVHKALNVKGTVDLEVVHTLINGQSKELALSSLLDTGAANGNADPTHEVSDILGMWSAIERGYKHLSLEEKEQVESEAGPLGRGVRFSGFDDGAESKHRDIAHTLIEESGRFDRFQGRNLSACMPTLDGYRRMLRLFGSSGPVSADAKLNVRQIIALANAEKYAG